jgi:hypothetical protein
MADKKIGMKKLAVPPPVITTITPPKSKRLVAERWLSIASAIIVLQWRDLQVNKVPRWRGAYRAGIGPVLIGSTDRPISSSVIIESERSIK